MVVDLDQDEDEKDHLHTLFICRTEKTEFFFLALPLNLPIEILMSLKVWSSLVEGDEGSYVPNTVSCCVYEFTRQ